MTMMPLVTKPLVKGLGKPIPPPAFHGARGAGLKGSGEHDRPQRTSRSSSIALAECLAALVKLVHSECKFHTQYSTGLFQGAILISFNACEDVGDLYQVMARKYPQRDDIVFAIRRLREALLKCSALVGFPRVFPRKHRSADAAAGYQWSVSSECSHSERRQGSTRSYSPPPV